MASQLLTNRRQGAGHTNVVTSQLLAAQLTVVVSSLAVNVLSARALGPAGRGHLTLLLQLAYLPGLFAIAGADRVYPALVNPASPTLRRAIGDLVRLVGPATACAAVGISVAAFVFDTSQPLTAVAIAIVAAGTVGTGVLKAASAAATTGRVYLTATVASNLCLIAYCLTLALSHVASPGAWIGAYAAGLAVLPGVVWAMTRHHTAGVDETSNLPGVRRAGWRVLPAAAASMLMLRSDRLLLPLLGGFEAAGWYIVIATLTEAVTWPAVIWVDTHVPQWRTTPPRPLRTLAAVAGYGVAAAGAVTASGYLLIVPIFGVAFRDSLPLLAPLSGAAAVYCVSRAAIGLALAAGRMRAAIWTDLPALLVALLAYLMLIPMLGAKGAAWGSLAGYTAAAVIALVLAFKRAEVKT